MRAVLAAAVFWPIYWLMHGLRVAARWTGERVLPAIDRAMHHVEGFACDRIEDGQDLYHRINPVDHYLNERYGLEEKPPGWNEAVLGHFHNGPECRHVTSAFSEAFHRRAQNPPKRKPSPWPMGLPVRRVNDVAAQP